MERRAFLTGSVGALGTIAASSARAQPAASLPAGFVRLRVVPGELTVDGKVGKAYRIEREDGRLGWVGRRGGRFQVALDNGLADPLSIHWHGLILPDGQDGVPYVTQPPIKPGERRLYDFPLVQAGTYWMHSHFGLQEQIMVTAPLIIVDERSPHPMRDVVMMLNDFTTRDPAAILESLQTMPMGGMKMAGSMKKGMGNKPDLTDVTYDYFVSTGPLGAQAIAVDGEDIVPLAGTRFELGVAQRIDLRVQIPRGGGAYPIIAQAEGTDGQAGIVLATAGTTVPTLSPKAPRVAGALTNQQEARLRALHPLARRPIDRRLRVTLGGDMRTYVWNLNGQVWPKITPLEVKQGERVEITFENQTPMTHPMHLHGHVFQVTAVGGAPVSGARRDTVLVSPKQTVKVEFDALYPGYWMIHCHLLYHQAAGMMTVMHYQGFENRSYDPLASLAEFPRR